MKAISNVFMYVFWTLLAIAFIISLYFFGIGGFLKISTIFEGSEVDRHAVILANVLISSDKLSYSDENKIYRGLLDLNKLNRYFVSEGTFDIHPFIIKSNPIIEEFSYPNSEVYISVWDFDAQKSWVLAGNGPSDGKLAGFGSCIFSKIKLDPRTIFRLIAYHGTAALGGKGITFVAEKVKIPVAQSVNLVTQYTWSTRLLAMTGIWDQYDLKECENAVATKSGTTSKSFPVAIRISENEIHLGSLNIQLTEYKL